MDLYEQFHISCSSATILPSSIQTSFPLPQPESQTGYVSYFRIENPEITHNPKPHWQICVSRDIVESLKRVYDSTVEKPFIVKSLSYPDYKYGRPYQNFTSLNLGQGCSVEVSVEIPNDNIIMAYGRHLPRHSSMLLFSSSCLAITVCELQEPPIENLQWHSVGVTGFGEKLKGNI